MEIFELALVLAVSVLVSALLSQVVKRISTPLIQIAIGVIISFLYGGGSLANFQLNEELFLVLFIAPLLYNEAKNVDKLVLWSNKKTIVSLAVGLVIAITLSVGYTMHALIPSIGLAACFALGAALGPTDAVAVSSLSSVTNISRRQRGILGGESLINDASGLVAFQFAIAAAVTGTFSLIDAAGSFIVLFFGGILTGIIIGILATWFNSVIRRSGFDNNTFHVLFDILLPFVVFLFGEFIGVSGILAVVACGIIFNIAPRETTPTASKVRITSSSFWSVLEFALNGIVFTLLGLQLQSGFAAVIGADGSELGMLVEAILIVTLILVAVRFLWVLITELLLSSIHGERRKLNRELIKHGLVITFAGAKGAITLSIVFMIPSALIGSDTLATIAAGVILVTLLLSNFIVPLLAPSQPKTFSEEAKSAFDFKISVFRRTIKWLVSEQNDENSLSTRTVVNEYENRIARLRAHADEEDENNVSLRLEAKKWEEEKALALLGDEGYDDGACYQYLYEIRRAASNIEQRSNLGGTLTRAVRRFTAMFHILGTAVWKLISAGPRGVLTSIKNSFARLGDRVAVLFTTRDIDSNNSHTADNDGELRDEACDAEKPDANDRQRSEALSNASKKRAINGVRRECAEYVLDKLREAMDEKLYPAEDISAVMTEYTRILRITTANTTSPSVTQIIKMDDATDKLRIAVLNYELELIEEAYSDNKIPRSLANSMKRNVYTMRFDIEGVLELHS